MELVPRKQPQLRFLVTSYHGEYNKGSEDKKKQQSRALIGAVGGVAKRQDAPALIGGDWNVTLVDHNSGMAVCSNSPTEWTAQLG